MKKFSTWLSQRDTFGEPITINYKGDNRYRTVFGATLTIIENIVFLIVATIGVIDLYNYKDP